MIGTVMRDSSSDATSPAISEIASPWKIGSNRMTADPDDHRRRRQRHRPEAHGAGVDHRVLDATSRPARAAR